MRVLVTGGAGYIGTHVVAAAQRAGHKTVVLDSLATALREPSGPWVRGDIRSADAVTSACNGADVIVHLAALSDLRQSIREPERYLDVNHRGTQVLRAHATAPIVFASSAAVYGHASTSLDAAGNTVNPYGESKWLAEAELGEGDSRLRLFNVVGASDDGTLGEDHATPYHLITLACRAVLGLRPPLRLFGTSHPTPDGTCVRDYVHVEDVASALLLEAERLARGATGRTLNVGRGTGVSVLEVLRAVSDAAGKPVPMIPDTAREGDPARLVSEAPRAQIAERALEQMVASALRWEVQRAGLADGATGS